MINTFISTLTPDLAAAFLQVMAIDLVLAGDNAVVIGLAAAGLPAESRARAILVGIIAATVLRLAFAAVAVELLAIRRPAARGRHFAALGLLENVARAARAQRGRKPRPRSGPATRACRARPSLRPLGKSS